MKFQDLPEITVQEVHNAIKRNDPDELQFVSLTLALSDLDVQFTESVCIQLCSSTSSRVRSNALVSLGHLARRFRSLDEGVVKPVIEKALIDMNEEVRLSAKSAADEIHQFLHWHMAGHVYG